MPTEIAGSKRLDWLKRQMDQAFGEVETITNRAVDDDRDVTDAEQRTCEARRARIAELESELEVEADLAQRSDTYRNLVAHIGPAQDQPLRGQLVERQGGAQDVPTYSSPGAYLVDFLTRAENPEAAQRFSRYLERAVAHQTTTQNPGLLPVSILGPVFTTQASRRPAIESATQRALPGTGKTFQRPKISQYTLAGPQTAEKTELPSRPMLIDPITVTKSTYGGVINLSWQDRDWSDPGIMDIIVADLAASYANTTDAAFVSYFAGTVTQTQPLATPDSEGLLGAIFAATGTIFSQTNTMPDTLWVAPNVWGALGAMVDSTGRQMFATVNPVNGLGTLTPQSMTGSLAGYKLAVDKNLAAGTAILGDSTYVEVYETIGGQVSAIEPSVMGTQIGFYGYIAWLTLEPKAFVKLTGVPVIPFSGNGGTPAQSTPHSGTKAK